MLQDLHDFIRDTIRKKRAGFVDVNQITEAIAASSKGLWKELITKYRQNGQLNRMLVPFKNSELGAKLSNSKYTLANAADSHIDGVAIVVSPKEYPTTLLHEDGLWVQRRFLPRENKTFLLKRQEYAHPVSSTQELPADYKNHNDVVYFYDNTDKNVYEGQILEHDEFYNRKNSYILAPDAQNPIATIYDGTIEFAPETELGDRYILPYDAYTDEKNGFSRYEPSGTGMVVEVDGSTSGTINIYYIDFPSEPSHATPTYNVTTGLPDPLVSVVEMGWGDDAFSELANGALTYLGVSIQNPQASQVEQVKTVTEAQSNN